MRKIFMSLSVLFSALFTGACSAAPAPEIPADAIWLDVRTEKEFAEKSIPGSILIPHEKIPAEAKEKLPDKNQNHQLSWWYALCLEGIFAGSPIRALNEIFIRIKFTGYC